MAPAIVSGYKTCPRADPPPIYRSTSHRFSPSVNYTLQVEEVTRSNHTNPQNYAKFPRPPSVWALGFIPQGGKFRFRQIRTSRVIFSPRSNHTSPKIKFPRPLEFRDRCSTRLEFRDRCSALPLEFRDRDLRLSFVTAGWFLTGA